jgi:RimJ/RimL family protein N-acetyltransferase
MIATERLQLREFLVSDAADFYALNADPEVIRYTGDSDFESVAAAAEFLRTYNPYRTEGMGRWGASASRMGLIWVGVDCGMCQSWVKWTWAIGFFESTRGRGVPPKAAKHA